LIISTLFIIFISLLFIPLTYYTLRLLFSQKDYHNYIKDNLFESENMWYWKWKEDDVDMLHSKCSKCDTILHYDENKINNMVFYFCPKCNSQEMKMKGCTYSYSQFLLKREIKRKYFEGKYTKKL
jgi:hypothetical protein